MKRFIHVSFQFEGIHRWKDCPHDDVAFLRDYHRHIFHVKARIEVSHNDRELEFIRVKRELEEYCCQSFEGSWVAWSCEMFATVICDHIRDLYGDRDVSVIILEDGENGGEVVYEREQSNQLGLLGELVKTQ